MVPAASSTIGGTGDIEAVLPNSNANQQCRINSYEPVDDVE